MLELLGPWAANNVVNGLVVVTLFFMYRDQRTLNRDLRKHMDDETKWRTKRDDWEKNHNQHAKAGTKWFYRG